MLRIRSESGVALATALVLTLTIVVLGTGLIVSTRGAQRVETGFKNQQRTFELAVAGLEHAREEVRKRIFDPATAGTVSYDTLLTTAAGTDGALVDSRSLANFSVVNGLPTVDDVPIVANQTLGGATYNVYLTNDPWDGVDSENDDDNSGPGLDGDGKHVVTLTSFARGANGEGFSAVQGIYRGQLPFQIPQLPGVVTLPGPAIDFSKGSSAVINGAGGDPPCFAAIATSRNSATTDVIDEITTSPNRNNLYTTCNPSGAGTLNATGGAVQNFIDTGAGSNPYAPGETNAPTLTPPGNGGLRSVSGCSGDDRDFIRVSCLDGLIASLDAQISAVGGYRGAAPTDAELGSPTNPKIAIVTANLTRNGTGNYGGILVVTGDFEMGGTTTYTGTILVVGTGRARVHGNAVVCGGILVADTLDNNDDGWDDFADQTSGPATISAGWVGRPRYDHDGGGNGTMGICSDALTTQFQNGMLPFAQIAFQQLR